MAQKKRRVKKHRKFWLGVKIFILLLLLTILIGGIVLYFRYGEDIFAMQDEARALVQASTEETFRTSETTVVYNSEGKQLMRLKGDRDTYYITFENIPKAAQDAFIVTEDRKFYSHNGIDGEGIIRAAVELIKNKGEKTQGASTITQQLARGTFLTTEKTYTRKIKEIFIAQELENKYTKEQILEFYINTIYFANGYYGLEAAARGYFSKGSKELSLAQICFLCAIPNNPTLYNPENNYDNTIKRKNRILDQLLSEGVINQIEYDNAYNEKIKLKTKELKKRDYVETFVMHCATRAIMKENGFEFKNEFLDNTEKEEYDQLYEEEFAVAQHMLLNDGYRIYTSIDLKKQKALQSAINKNLSAFKEKSSNGMYKMQGASVCIDNSNGRVVAIVGGRSQQMEGYSLNRAFQSFRQPGSSIKPILVYTPSLERGYTASSTVKDHKFEGGPSNSSGRYYGHVSLRFAVEQSLNTVAWQLFEELTPQTGLNYLLQMNFSRIVKNDYYLPASLGGMTYGASPLEMASAYATLENNGKYREPTCIVKILDSAGNTIVEDDVDEKYIYNADAANAMTDILQGVFTSGTARGLGFTNGMSCAGKTGTTNDKKDGWFCGYTPYYTTSVWIGYDSPQSVSDLYGSTYPGRTWRDFMLEIHDGLKVKEFKYEKKWKKEEQTTIKKEQEKDGISGDVDIDPADKDNKVDKDPADNPTKAPTVTKSPATATPAPTKVPATKAPATPTPEPVGEEPGEDLDEVSPE